MKSSMAGLSLTVVLLGVSFVLSAKGQQNSARAAVQDTKGQSVYDELSKAPPKARAKRNPLEKDPEAVAAGRILFEQHCAECHGKSAEGSRKAPSLLAPEVQSATPGTLFWLLTNGVVRKKMPVWSKLPEPQRWQLVRYIKSLGSAPAAESPAPKP